MSAVKPRIYWNIHRRAWICYVPGEAPYGAGPTPPLAFDAWREEWRVFPSRRWPNWR